MNLPFDIVIVSAASKPCLTEERLLEQGVPHIRSITPDYEYPIDSEKIAKTNEIMCANKIGQYRCFRGHQDALSKSTKDYVLVLEDDVGFNLSTEEWIQVVTDNLSLADEYDIAYMHLRAEATKTYLKDNKYVIATDIGMGQIIGGFTVKRGLGTLAYLVNAGGRQKILDTEWNGMPIDIRMSNFFNYAWVKEPDLFTHDHQVHGSLTDNPK